MPAGRETFEPGAHFGIVHTMAGVEIGACGGKGALTPFVVFFVKDGWRFAFPPIARCG